MGSEMCIRDRLYRFFGLILRDAFSKKDLSILLFIVTISCYNHVVKKLLRIFLHLFVVIVVSPYDFRNFFLGKVIVTIKRNRILLKALYFINIVVTLPSI